VVLNLIKAVTWEINCRSKIRSIVDVTHTHTYVAKENKEVFSKFSPCG
jgi:hypothetical protein